MLKVRSRKILKWCFASGYLLLAAAMLGGLGLIGFTLFGFVGVIGVLIVLGAILLVGLSAVVEDERPGGFNNPSKPDSDKGRRAGLDPPP